MNCGVVEKIEKSSTGDDCDYGQTEVDTALATLSKTRCRETEALDAQNPSAGGIHVFCIDQGREMPSEVAVADAESQSIVSSTDDFRGGHTSTSKQSHVLGSSPFLSSSRRSATVLAKMAEVSKFRFRSKRSSPTFFRSSPGQELCRYQHVSNPSSM